MQKDSIWLQISNVEAEIAGLTARLPRHSTPPAMLLRLEELEDELSLLRAQLEDPLELTGPNQAESEEGTQAQMHYPPGSAKDCG